MAYDEGLAQLMRDDLAGVSDIEEKRMFGGICFMWRNHMLAGVHKGGAMYRIGKEASDDACRHAGVGVMTMTGRPMKGIVDVSTDVMGDDGLRTQLLGLAKAFVQSLPPKD